MGSGTLITRPTFCSPSRMQAFSAMTFARHKSFPYLSWLCLVRELTSSLRTAYRLDSAHQPAVRDVDFNPNRQHIFATGGDDSRIRFWDSRKLAGPLKVLAEHSHWSLSPFLTPAVDRQE